MEIICTHASSDFDSFAGMIAAKKLYPDAEIVLPNSINQNVRKFISLHEDSLPQLNDFKYIDPALVNKIIIIDTKIPSRLGDIKSIIDNYKPQLVVFDHHKKSNEDVSYGSFFLKNYGATTTIIVELIKKNKIDISPIEATLFLLGIFEDTGSFTFPATTYRDLEIAAYLKKRGANLFIVNKFLNLSLTQQQHVLLEKLIHNIKKININEKEIIISSAETENFVEGLSVLARKLAQIEDVDIVFCWVKMKDKIYVVGRSDDNSLDVSKVLESVGGGGHQQAASAVLKDLSFSEIENNIIASIYRNIKKPILARDIMSFPIRVVDENTSIIQTYEILKKYGHSGMPIVDSSKNLVGIITRKDIDKAIKHGLGHAPVKGFKSKGIITTGPNTTIDEIQRLMIENGIGRIPIVQKNEVIGIVTRKDILRYYQEDKGQKIDLELRRGRAKVNKYSKYYLTNKDVINRLKVLIPPQIYKILETVSDIAKELKMRAYLVGGIVRDLLLEVQNLDIDIVVEGSGIDFAKRLAERVGARVESYKKFNTAVVILNNGQHIDVATARIEYYQKPAALPDVEPGNLNQDLARRDFTINTLALSLNKNDFGKIIDFFGGRKDLANKKIKVLHKLSFIEDPTRIFRAVRFEQRLGFKMEKQTEKLALSSIEMDIVSKLNGIRIREELIAILKEAKPWNAIKRLQKLNALSKIGLNIKVDKGFINYLKRISDRYEVLNKFIINPNFQVWRVYIIALLIFSDFYVNKSQNQSQEFLKEWCSYLKFKNKETQIIIDAVLKFENLKSILVKKIKKYSELYKYLKDSSDELLIFLAAVNKISFDNIFTYYSVVSKIKLDINGNDLKKLNYKPSKNFKIVLEEVLNQKLDGLIKNKAEELIKAKQLLKLLEGN